MRDFIALDRRRGLMLRWDSQTSTSSRHFVGHMNQVVRDEHYYQRQILMERRVSPREKQRILDEITRIDAEYRAMGIF